MVKTAKDRARCNSAKSLDDAMERRVLDQRSVSSEFVVIVGIRGQDPAQVRFAQDHDMIQAVSSDRADEPFDMSILPGRAGRRWSIPDAVLVENPSGHGICLPMETATDDDGACAENQIRQY